MYEITMVCLMKHLEEVREKQNLLTAVDLHEKQTIRRLGEEFSRLREVHQNSSNIKQWKRKNHEESLKTKVTHGYL